MIQMKEEEELMMKMRSKRSITKASKERGR